MEFLLGILAAFYGLGFLLGLCFFCLHVGLVSSRLPFTLRFAMALLVAILWPLGFALYGPFMSWRDKRLRQGEIQAP